MLSRPGENLGEVVYSSLNALFIPTSGALRSIRWLTARPALASDELRRAARTGALCTVIKRSNTAIDRSTWDPWCQKMFKGHARVVWLRRKVHGRCIIPRGYRLVELPTNVPLKSSSDARLQLAYTYNIPKVLVGLFQVIWGSVTLYQARGDQIATYGYASFGLSVIPYIFMSAVNIASALVTPEYQTLYLVHSPDMDEFKTNFDGVVASLDTESSAEPVEFDTLNSDFDSLFLWFGYPTIMLGPLCILGGLSYFRAAESSVADRGWLMAWYTSTILTGLWVRIFGTLNIGYSGATGRGFVAEYRVVLMSLLGTCFAWVPAIGGMAVVGRQLHDYGVCTKVGA